MPIKKSADRANKPSRVVKRRNWKFQQHVPHVCISYFTRTFKLKNWRHGKCRIVLFLFFFFLIKRLESFVRLACVEISLVWIFIFTNYLFQGSKQIDRIVHQSRVEASTSVPEFFQMFWKIRNSRNYKRPRLSAEFTHSRKRISRKQDLYPKFTRYMNELTAQR